jgi:CRP/FNR family cyclic AMP-dependent transcriptional regulator
VAVTPSAVETGDDPRALLERSGAFGGLVLSGLLLEAVNIDKPVSLRLLGPGVPIPPRSLSISLPWKTSRVLAPARARVVLLDERYLFAVRRWPSLARALHARMSEHAQRHAAQLAISHLPRVEDRLMALMWPPADTWGRVTPAGIRLELSLSHEGLGGLIGARRSTVTLALGQLAERNALIRQDDIG